VVILGAKGLSGVVKYVFDLTFLLGALVLLTLPFSLKMCFDNYIWTEGEYFWFLFFFLEFTGILGLAIIYELRKMFQQINKNEPFVRQNVTSLKKIAGLALLIAAAYVVKIIFYISFLTIIIAIAFVIFGLSGLVFSEVFRQAVRFKEENDLTI
jgi:hypothetical protein